MGWGRFEVDKVGKGVTRRQTDAAGRRESESGAEEGAKAGREAPRTVAESNGEDDREREKAREARGRQRRATVRAMAVAAVRALLLTEARRPPSRLQGGSGPLASLQLFHNDSGGRRQQKEPVHALPPYPRRDRKPRGACVNWRSDSSTRQ